MSAHQHQHSKALLLTLGATTGAVAGCVLAHRLWLRQRGVQEQDSRWLTSSSTWLPQLLLLQGCAASPAAAQLSAVTYDYAQSIEEVLVEAQLPAHIQQQDVAVKFGRTSLLLVVGQQRVIEGQLAGGIVPQHSSWKIEGQGPSRKLSITLCKQPATAAATGCQQRYAVWSSLLQQEDTQVETCAEEQQRQD